MTRTLLVLALAQLATGTALHALLPRLGLGYAGTLAAVTVVGALWLGGAGTLAMTAAAGMVDAWQRMKAR